MTMPQVSAPSLPNTLQCREIQFPNTLQQTNTPQIHCSSRQPCLGQRVCICPKYCIVFLAVSRLFPPPQAASFNCVQQWWCLQFAPCGLASAICPLWNVILGQHWKTFFIFLQSNILSFLLHLQIDPEYDEAYSHSLHLWDLNTDGV